MRTVCVEANSCDPRLAQRKRIAAMKAELRRVVSRSSGRADATNAAERGSGCVARPSNTSHAASNAAIAKNGASVAQIRIQSGAGRG
jgi:hypothetical protein